MDRTPRLLLIGLGNIGRYIFPCCSAVLGDRIGEDLLCVKATPSGIEELRARFPFPIRTDGDCRRACFDLEPDVILVACRPHQIQPLVERDLLPYYDSCRKLGRPLPAIYSYAPAPEVTWFRRALGEEVLASNIIPNMVDYTAGLSTASITHNMVTLDPEAVWPAERMELLKRFLAPQGLFLPCRVEESIPLMCAKVTSHRLYDICTALAAGFEQAGRSAHHNQVADCGRALLRSRFSSFGPDIWHCAANSLPEDLRQFTAAVLGAWYDGIVESTVAAGADRETCELFTRGMFDLHLLTVSLVDQAQLDQNTRDHTTPGGVQEHSCLDFAAGPRDKLQEQAAAFASGRPQPQAAAEWQQIAADLNRGLIAFSTDIDKR